MVLGGDSVGGGWKWRNERGLEGVEPIEREGIWWVEWWRVVDGWGHRKQEIDRGDQWREHQLRLKTIEKRENGSRTKERDREGICVERERVREKGQSV